ncbi:hypothetical protein GQ43DRAFT_375133 [Delitschia confertaspora ATCC 74209]|uniref:DUF7624 domain-containing protein n=1 Tax=Delitschia confertaspora ATCC 74209 TaxID=1513339 RepID=A0A9P4JKM0_9PLEO|nr:hypothetical protein GQ43DRAFT_375133 [Delitschia confertaspora ATCC 74209]
MATVTQLMPSPTQGLKSAFSPYTDSPSSPAPFSQLFSNRSSGNAQDHLIPPPSPYPATVDPSPVDSNGTISTDANVQQIEDDAQVNQVNEDGMSDIRSPDTNISDLTSPASQDSHTKLSKLDTAIPARTRADSDDAPQSVIHAPTNYKSFNRASISAASSSETRSDNTVIVSPQTPEAHLIPDVEKYSETDEGDMTRASQHTSSTYTYPIDTAVPPPGPSERTTPRAQTRQEVEEERRRSRVSMSLADIAETDDNGPSDMSAATSISDFPIEESLSFSIGTQTMGEALQDIKDTEMEIAGLRSALSECWTLCNTLAKLSRNHRERIFHFSGEKGDVQEQAWRSCWRLCQKLYDTQNEDHSSQVKPTLELCREFCQALFEVRQRSDPTADSILRVSFELNNHLYNAHDRALPDAFQERTLDFYLTLCHRLMKQRTSLPEETDALLHACWSLAEMLFSIRQNSRDGKSADEELLVSAIQACWELCDLFREGWTQVRPERGTPRPSQYTFVAPPSASYSQSQASRSERSIGRSSSMNESYHSAVSMRGLPIQPETPTTIFDDREEDFSPAEEQNVPNILILGPENGQTRTHDRWSSAASSLSTYSETSHHTSSTATAGREDPNLARLKGLIIKAAINTGYSRQTPLPDFIRALPSNSFGSADWQIKLYENYKKLILSDPTLKHAHLQPLRRLTASEIGRAVQWMARSDQFNWMRDLYRFVFGSFPEDTGQRNLIINA